MASSNKTRVLGIDFGYARIGLALSDPLRMLASGLETIRWNGLDWDWAVERICELCRLHNVDELVIGLPLRTDGKRSDTALKAEEFARVLKEKTELEAIFQDERFTTRMATSILQNSHVKKDKRRAVIDQLAAEIILQTYLDSRR